MYIYMYIKLYIKHVLWVSLYYIYVERERKGRCMMHIYIYTKSIHIYMSM